MRLGMMEQLPNCSLMSMYTSKISPNVFLFPKRSPLRFVALSALTDVQKHEVCLRAMFDEAITAIQSVGVASKIINAYLTSHIRSVAAAVLHAAFTPNSDSRNQGKCFSFNVEKRPMKMGSYAGASIPLGSGRNFTPTPPYSSCFYKAYLSLSGIGIFLGLLSFVAEIAHKYSTDKNKSTAHS